MIDTPSILIDTRAMERNIERMAKIVRDAGVALRPHSKTHKSPEIARMQLRAGAPGVTVAKVGEAEVMVRGGIRDLFIAYPLANTAKIDRALDLAESAHIIFAADSIEIARLLAERASRRGQVAEVRLEVDSGMRRTGVKREKARSLARAVADLKGLSLTGIFTFRGSLIDGRPTLDRKRAGLEEGQIMAELAEALRSDGIPIREVSVGSTPTAEYAAIVPGVTEVRPGTYVFCDRAEVAYGVCETSDCAATLLVTVVSRPADDYVVVDGGSKSLSADSQPDKAPTHLRGFGEVVGFPDAVVDRMSEEHGIVSIRPEHPFKVGDRLRIIPNHVCTTINLHNVMYLTESPDAVAQDPNAPAEELPVAGRGMVR